MNDEEFASKIRHKSALIVELQTHMGRTGQRDFLSDSSDVLDFSAKCSEAAKIEGEIAAHLLERGKDPVVNLLSQASLLVRLGTMRSALNVLDELYEYIEENYALDGQLHSRMCDEIRKLKQSAEAPLADFVGRKLVQVIQEYPVYILRFDNGQSLNFTVDARSFPHDCFTASDWHDS